MVKTTLIFIRHGYSEANEQNIFAGITDVPLTELGKQQAKQTAQFLLRYNIDVLYSSDLKRAKQTAEPISQKTGLPIIQREELREMDLGKWERLPFASVVNDFPNEYALWVQNVDNAAAPSGESVAELRARMTKAVEQIVKEQCGKTACIVTHAEALRVLFPAWTGARLVDVPYVPNSSVTVVEYENGKGSVVLNGFAEHLGELTTRLPALA